MIPVRLELKNFLPYRSPDPIKFDGIHLACLTGPNGAGKLSLLDAITYALWGKARAKRDEELVHLGQGDMYVQLDFEQEGVLWRVLRRRSGGKKGTGTLDLFILQEDGQKTLQSEGSMKLTQEKINRVLRLDYETFVHSAFLQQGKADAFTTRTPAQRKQILSDILGLERWERFEEAVKERLKNIEGQIRLCEMSIQEIDAELARKPALEAQRDDAGRAHADAQAMLTIAEARLKEVEDAPVQLRNAQDNKAACERRLRDHQRDLAEVEERIERQRKQIADYEEIIAVRDEIEAGYNALQSARTADQNLSDKLRQLKTLDDTRYELRSQLEAARARLESEAASLEARIEELNQITDNVGEGDLESVQAEVAGLQAMEDERDTLDEQMNGLREDRVRLEEYRKTLTAEGKEMRERLDKLQATEDAICPLCGQELDEEHRTQLVEQLTAEVESLRETFKKNNEAIHEVAAHIMDHKSRQDALSGDLKRLPPLMERVGLLQGQVEQAYQASLRLEEESQRLHEVRAELENDTFAADVRQQLGELDQQQTELGYDSTAHDDTRRALEDYHRYDQMQTRLTIALELLVTLQEGLDGSLLRVERLNQAMGEIQEEIDGLNGEIARLGVLVEEYNAREAEVRAQRTRERSAYERLVSAEQALKSLEAQAIRKAELEARRDKARYDESLYNELKRAFGKNGIPAMIIETAIPELEVTANDLLARMTDGRMHLKMNTQREKITGGVQETLDIEIADELGTRAYELYSGGEAFRINFAIRVALSQLLARRAGAHLRTLFIDEGFGTQDESGRNKLVEAITAIQDEFDMILVITHIDDLRDSFPVHIVVDKTSTGSRVAVR